MSIKNMGFSLIGFGIFGVIFSFIVDYIGFGKPGIQAAQLLGIQLGIILLVIGLGFVKTKRTKSVHFVSVVKDIFDWLLSLPTFVWIIVGFLIAYVLLFIFPVFFNPEHRLLYFNRYIPDKAPIGLDLNTIVNSISNWLSNDQGIYQNPDIFYPPLHHILLAPLLLFTYPQSYYLIVAIILISLFVLSFLIPVLIDSKRDYAIPVFFFTTTLFSYGFQFELERGQFNIITFTLCILAIYLFYFHESFRFLAYLFFSFSVHLRIYPAIFIVMFIYEWTAWKQNLKRLFGIGILNLTLLFVLGYSVLIEFLQAISGKLGTAWTWIGNHSVTSFIYNLTTSGFGLFKPDTLLKLKENSHAITIALLGYYAICFVAVILKDYLKKKRGLNPDLLLICTVGGLIIPSVSHDYKLALLAGPMAIALSNRIVISTNWKRLLSILLIAISSLAYSFTLFPPKYRPAYFENSFPLLIIILTAITILSFIAGPKYLGPNASEE